MPPRNILVPVDGSGHAHKAVAYADDLADICGARISLIHVMKDAGSYRLLEELRELAQIEHIEITERDVLLARAENILEEATTKVTKCSGNRLTCETLIGDAAEEIARYARERGIDLIVIGSRGLGDFQGLLLGSVSHKVVQVASCPCLVVRTS